MVPHLLGACMCVPKSPSLICQSQIDSSALIWWIQWPDSIIDSVNRSLCSVWRNHSAATAALAPAPGAGRQSSHTHCTSDTGMPCFHQHSIHDIPARQQWRHAVRSPSVLAGQMGYRHWLHSISVTSLHWDNDSIFFSSLGARCRPIPSPQQSETLQSNCRKQILVRSTFHSSSGTCEDHKLKSRRNKMPGTGRRQLPSYLNFPTNCYFVQTLHHFKWLTSFSMISLWQGSCET